MLKKFINWLIYFGLSFLVESFGWAEQGRAFFFIHFELGCLLLVVLLFLAIFVGFESFTSVLLLSGEYAIPFVVAWVTAKFLGVDFYVVYQIIALIMCLFPKQD